MRIDDLVDQLQRTDLSSDECRVLVQLLRGGPQRASEVASATDLHRTKVYRILDALQERRLVQSSVGRPTIYEARPPHHMFEQFEEDLSDELDHLQAIRSDLLPTLEELHEGSPEDTAGPHWKMLEGRTRILEHLRNVAGGAQRSIEVMSTHELSTHLVPEVRSLWETALARTEDGVAFRGLFRPTPGSWDQVMDWADRPGAELRYLDTDRHTHVDLVDGEQVLLWVVVDDSRRLRSEDDVAVWTDAPGLVDTLQLAFDALWAASDPIQEHRPPPTGSEDGDGSVEEPTLDP